MGMMISGPHTIDMNIGDALNINCYETKIDDKFKSKAPRGDEQSCKPRECACRILHYSDNE